MGEPRQETQVIDITPKEEPRPPEEKSGVDVIS
jgi:hypothetical protein